MTPEQEELIEAMADALDATGDIETAILVAQEQGWFMTKRHQLSDKPHIETLKLDEGERNG